MFAISLRLILILFAVSLCLPMSDAFRNRGYGAKSSKETGKQRSAMGSEMAAQTPSPSPARRGIGISAWGLITLIVSVILAIAGMYYFSICYPVLCKKTRKYDMIHSPNLA